MDVMSHANFTIPPVLLLGRWMGECIFVLYVRRERALRGNGPCWCGRVCRHVSSCLCQRRDTAWWKLAWLDLPCCGGGQLLISWTALQSPSVWAGPVCFRCAWCCTCALAFAVRQRKGKTAQVHAEINCRCHSAVHSGEQQFACF